MKLVVVERGLLKIQTQWKILDLNLTEALVIKLPKDGFAVGNNL